MDPMSWTMLCWLAAAALIFFTIHKAVELWPKSARGVGRIEAAKAIEEKPLTKSTVFPSAKAAPTFATATRNVTTTASAPEQQPRLKLSEEPAWLNEMIGWFCSHYEKTPPLVDAWLQSLNDVAKKAVNAQANVEVLFEEVIGQRRGATRPPKITWIKSDFGPRDHLTIKAEVEVPLVTLRLVSSQRNEDRLLVNNYDVRLTSIVGEVQLRIACIGDEVFLMGCFNGRPTMNVQLTNTDATPPEDSVDPAAVENLVRKCLTTGVTNITLSNVQVASGKPAAERSSVSLSYERPSSASSSLPPVDLSSVEGFELIDFLGVTYTSTAASPIPKESRKRFTHLRTRVVRAQKLGEEVDVHLPYVTLELDEPNQKFQTSKGINAHPFWEEDFIFELSEKSDEIMFELYDDYYHASQRPADYGEEKTTADVFLGLALVSFEEIHRQPGRAHKLNLQGRPYHRDKVSGSITVEFEFLSDGVTLPPSSKEEKKFGHDETYADAHPSGVSDAGGLLVKSVSQNFVPADEAVKQESNLEEKVIFRQDDGLVQKSSVRPASAIPLSNELSSTGAAVQQEHTRGRRPHRRRSFFDELRDRLSLHRRGNKANRARSADAVRHHAAAVPADSWDSAPHSRDESEPRRGGERSRSPFEASSSSFAGSSHSLYSRSTLVVELQRNNIRRYYLIPADKMSSPICKQLMKKGRKLHIFNEHTFIAVRVPGRTLCDICHRPIGRSFHKQAYQCRDCRMISHKTCHYKTDGFCQCSNVASLPLEYITPSMTL